MNAASCLKTVMVMLLLAGSQLDVGAQQQQQNSNLPLLSGSSPVLGTTRFGSADLPPAGDPVRARLEQAAAAGLSGFTLYLDWPILEPAPGQYAFAATLAQLDELQDLGLQTFINITVGDIAEYVVPAPFSDGAGGLAAGVRLDDAAVVQRFGAMLDALVPALVERGVFALAVGNEIDDRLDNNADERDAYRSFVAAARQRVQTLAPQLALGVTLTADAHRDNTPTRQAMDDVTDFIAVNYGPIDGNTWFVRPLDAIAADFAAVMNAMPDGPILIQELTCPNPESMNASLAWQAACFDILFNAIGQNPRIRFASIFTLEDFDGQICALVQSALGADLQDVSPGFRMRFLDYLCGLGILASDGTTHPAWDALMTTLATQPDELNLRGGFTGNWTDPAPNNQGIQIEVLDNNRAIVIWFTFDANGDQQWLGGLGSISNNRIEVDLRRVSGGAFPPELIEQDQISIEPWGHASISFSNCRQGQMSWTSHVGAVPSGTMPLRRVSALADLPCAAAERYHHNIHYSFDAAPGDWQALFADYSETVAADIGFAGEWGQLPTPLHSRHGYLLSGNNPSDDSGNLTMLLANQVSGLQPEALHIVRLEATIASNVPAGCVAIGGAPGESVKVKLGASTVRPEVMQDDGQFSFNIDTGNQTSGGEDATAVGDISNQQQCDEVGFPGTWQLKTLDNDDNPMLAVSDESGNIWVYFVTDSGFEGRSSVYVTDFRVAVARVTAGTVITP